MPTAMYKEPRICTCGFTTLGIRNWSQHKKYCKVIRAEQSRGEQERIASLEKQLEVKDRQLAAQAEENSQLRLLLQERLIDVTRELNEVRKRKDRYAEKNDKRVYRPEPVRRKIAIRQDWMCTWCSKELEEYDIDHIIPPRLGGTEAPENLQALCPGCHRKKTDQERMQRCSQY